MKDQDDALMRLAARVGKSLGERGQVVTTAESCTGGWIAKALTDVPGSSQWFGEGFVTYSNDAKVRSLGVSRAVLAREGAVSAAVARAMAQGALHRTGAELAVAVTGIAGPDGAVPGKPVGTVWFCWTAARRRPYAFLRRAQALSRGSRRRAPKHRAARAAPAGVTLRSEHAHAIILRRFSRPRDAAPRSLAAATLMLGDGARLVPCENYHITLAFVGEVSNAQAASLRTIGPLEVPAFTVRFDTYEHWLKSEVVVLAASECPPALHDLQCKLRGELAHHDLASDSRPFHPHVTIARNSRASTCAASDVGDFCGR